MAEIVPSLSVKPAIRTPTSTEYQKRGSFHGILVQGGNVQDATDDINFDLRNGPLSPLVAQRSREGRKAVFRDQATRMRSTVVKRATQALGDFAEVYGALFRNFLAELNIAQKKKSLNLSTARELAEQLFDDPSARHAAVLAAAQLAGEMGDSGMEQMLRNLAHLLMEEEGPAIRAGYNIDSVVALVAGERWDTFRTLREAYRSVLFSDMSEEEIYDFVVHLLPARLRHLHRVKRFKSKMDQKKNQKKRRPSWEIFSEESDDPALPD